MLCRSIAEKGLNTILESIKGAEMAEIRIEETGLSNDELSILFSSHPHLLATCRPKENTDAERLDLLKRAIDAGAKWVDIEIESNEVYTKELVSYAKSKACKVIISYHNYTETPNSESLNKIVEEAKKQEADIVKLACHVTHLSDNANLMALYSNNIPIIALGMGKLGMITRIAALKMGAPFTFVKGDNMQKTAPGQISESDLRSALSYL